MITLQSGAELWLYPISAEHAVLSVHDRDIAPALMSRDEVKRLVEWLTCFLQGGGDV